jgi:hypothetical protein
MKFDYKKEFKNLYVPKIKPSIVDIPEMNFIKIDGKGDPNGIEYHNAVELLYGLSYTIKMSYKSGKDIEGYFEYVVPPLEGLWWGEGNGFDINSRDTWLWTSMIRQPEFVTEEVFQWALESIKKKKPQLDSTKACLTKFNEGLCVQAMHMGPFADEPKTVLMMQDFMGENNLKDDIGRIRKHHEIYLSDPRKTIPSKLKTVLRHPVSPQGIG